MMIISKCYVWIVRSRFGYLGRTLAGYVREAALSSYVQTLLAVCTGGIWGLCKNLRILYEKYCWYLTLDLSVMHM